MSLYQAGGTLHSTNQVVTASARSLPALTYSIDEDMLANMTCTCPPSGSTSAGTRAAIRHVHEVDAGHHFEQFTENMVSGTDAAMSRMKLKLSLS